MSTSPEGLVEVQGVGEALQRRRYNRVESHALDVAATITAFSARGNGRPSGRAQERMAAFIVLLHYCQRIRAIPMARSQRDHAT